MTSTAAYHREYYRKVRRQRDGNRIGRAILALDKALEALTDEFNVGRAGPSGLRAQAIAQVRQARLLLEAPA